MLAVLFRSDRAFEQLVRAVGIMVWAVVGSPTWTRLFDDPASVPHPVVWSALYLGFAVAFVLATRADMPPATRRALVAAESLLAAALLVVGMPRFEGAMFAIVAAQIPTLVSPVRALVWDTAQAATLLPLLVPTYGWLIAVKSTGEYLAFALFALGVVAVREREAAARRELARSHAVLLGTQALLADDARASERSRVAREVHDAIGHGLTAASLHLQIAARTCEGSSSAAVASAGEAVRATLAEVRGLVGAMRDEAAVDLGTAVRAMCAGIHEPVLHVSIASPLRIPDAGIAHALFRCVQEGLTNALRHANARAIWIEIERDERGVTAIVRDDGIGVDQLTFGIGLDGLRDRLRELAGTLEAAPGAHGGIELRGWIPEEAPR